MTGLDPEIDQGDAASGMEPTHGLPTESKLFGATGTFALVIGVIYALTSGPEPAGTVALFAAGVFGLALAVFFARSLREVQHEVVLAEEETDAAEAAGTETDAGLYLPETSIWPFFLGIGAALTFTGFALGLWFLIPGLVLVVHSVIGFASQSRDRAHT